MQLANLISTVRTIIAAPLPTAQPFETDFHDLLPASVHGAPEARLLARFRQALLTIQAEPGGDILLRALRAHTDATGMVAQVVLDDSTAIFRTRPLNGVWYVDLDAMERNPGGVGVRELARLYEHMAQPAARGLDSFDRTRLPQPDASLEDSWRIWSQAGEPGEQRGEAIDEMRAWIGETGYYGGLTRMCMLDLISRIEQGQDIPDYVAELNLRNMGLRSLPRFPSTVRAVDASDNRVCDIEGSSTGLETLKLNRNRLDDARLRQVFRKLSNGLRELELNDNGFSAIAAAFPENLYRLSITRNAVQVLPPMPFALAVLDASHNRICNADALNALSELTDVNLHDNALSAIPLAIMRLPAGGTADLTGNAVNHVVTGAGVGPGGRRVRIEGVAGTRPMSVTAQAVYLQSKARIILDIPEGAQPRPETGPGTVAQAAAHGAANTAAHATALAVAHIGG